MTLSELRVQLHAWVETADVKLLKMQYAISKTYLAENAELAAEQEDDELYRLVYTSGRVASCDDACIQRILESAQKNNPRLGITGLLLHTEDRFIQILEGNLLNIMMIYRKISKDPRHLASRIRFCEPVKERHFSNWHMAYRHLETSEIAYKSDISDKEKKAYQSFLDGDITSYKDEGMRVLKSFLKFS